MSAKPGGHVLSFLVDNLPVFLHLLFFNSCKLGFFSGFKCKSFHLSPLKCFCNGGGRLYHTEFSSLNTFVMERKKQTTVVLHFHIFSDKLSHRKCSGQECTVYRSTFVQIFDTFSLFSKKKQKLLFIFLSSDGGVCFSRSG